jgi:hypothetical protein
MPHSKEHIADGGWNAGLAYQSVFEVTYFLVTNFPN